MGMQDLLAMEDVCVVQMTSIVPFALGPTKSNTSVHPLKTPSWKNVSLQYQLELGIVDTKLLLDIWIYSYGK